MTPVSAVRAEDWALVVGSDDRPDVGNALTRADASGVPGGVTTTAQCADDKGQLGTRGDQIWLEPCVSPTTSR